MAKSVACCSGHVVRTHEKRILTVIQEAAAKSLDLKEIDPELFDYVVNYIYTGGQS